MLSGAAKALHFSRRGAQFNQLDTDIVRVRPDDEEVTLVLEWTVFVHFVGGQYSHAGQAGFNRSAEGETIEVARLAKETPVRRDENVHSLEEPVEVIRCEVAVKRELALKAVQGPVHRSPRPHRVKPCMRHGSRCDARRVNE